MPEKLQKIAEIELAGERFDLARNGQFRLVRGAGEDAYGRPVAEVVDVYAWANQEWGRVQALLDALGEATVRLRGQKDLQIAAHGREGGEG